jgi:hypothetical protein
LSILNSATDRGSEEAVIKGLQRIFYLLAANSQTFEIVMDSSIVDRYGEVFDGYLWRAIAHYRPDLITDTVIERFGRRWGDEVWELLPPMMTLLRQGSLKRISQYDGKTEDEWWKLSGTQPKIFTDAVINKYHSQFNNQTWITLLAQRPELIDKFGHMLNKFMTLANHNPNVFSESSIFKYGSSFAPDTWLKIAKEGRLYFMSDRVIHRYGKDWGWSMWNQIIRMRGHEAWLLMSKLNPALISKLVMNGYLSDYRDRWDEDIIRNVMKYNPNVAIDAMIHTDPNKITELHINEFGGRIEDSIWEGLVKIRPDLFTEDIIGRFKSKFPEAVWEHLPPIHRLL